MTGHEDSRYRYTVRLLIKHPSIDPASITAELGLTPHLSWTAGETRATPVGTPLPGVYKESAWGYSYDIEKTRFFFRDVVSLLGQLEPHATFLSNIVTTGGTISVIMHLPGDINIGDVIGWAELNRLASLRMNLGIEVFPDFGDTKNVN